MKHFEIYKKDPATGALYPEGQRRKKGLARILEIVVRDFWQLLGSGLIATAAALPYDSVSCCSCHPVLWDR